MRRLTSAILLPLLGACAIAGPIVDSEMSDAPYQACHVIGAPAADQCVDLRHRDARGQWSTLSTDRLAEGDLLVAFRSTGAACQGNFTHFVVSGTADGPGELRSEVSDLFARGQVGRSFRLGEPGLRHWAVGEINTPVHNPASAQVRMLAGQVRLASVCFKSYRR